MIIDTLHARSLQRPVHMHPPAVSTAMIFAFQYKEADVLMLFYLAVLLLVILIFLQRASLWLVRKEEKER